MNTPKNLEELTLTYKEVSPIRLEKESGATSFIQFISLFL
jgi:hypothetical protein